MPQPLRMVVVEPIEGIRKQLSQQLTGLDGIALAAICSRYEYFYEMVALKKPDIAWVGIDTAPAQALHLIAKLSKYIPETAIMASGNTKHEALAVQCMKAGALGFLFPPFSYKTFWTTLEQICQSEPNGQSVAQPTVIAITGSNGGVGTTTCAVNLGVCLAREEHNRVLLTDMDLTLGTLDRYLGVFSDCDILDFTNNSGQLDSINIKDKCGQHSSGVFVMSRPTEFTDMSKITTQAVQSLLSHLKNVFNFIILDLSKSYTPLDQACMSMADEILIVTQLDAFSLRNANRLLITMSHRPHFEGKIKVIANQHHYSDDQPPLHQAAKRLGLDFLVSLPRDHTTFSEATKKQTPLVDYAPRSRSAHAFQHLAHELSRERDQLISPYYHMD